MDLLYTCLFQAQRAKLLLSKEVYRKFFKDIKSVVKDNKPSKKHLKSLSFKKKLRINSIYHFLGIVCKVQNFLGVGNESNI